MNTSTMINELDICSLLSPGGTDDYDDEENNVYNFGLNETIAIYSPNYPEKYPNYANVLWMIYGPDGYQIVATFLEFDIEPDYDYLRIGHGLMNDTSSMLVRLTGSSIPNDVVSLNNEMWLYFTSDSSVTYPCFWIEISVFNYSGNLLHKP